jgi:hypothetical protein
MWWCAGPVFVCWPRVPLPGGWGVVWLWRWVVCVGVYCWFGLEV